jgi:mannose-6-phosphate isomerase
VTAQHSDQSAPTISRLRGVLQRYAWGHLDAIPALLGEPADGRPVAEYWLGAHPNHPSTVDGQPLDGLIAANPVAHIGEESTSLYGPSLPFLLKVLAAAEPLSIQAHPNREQAMAGFARENQLGIAIDAPTRVYRDRNHKPELICALTEFVALCGFRPAEVTVALCESIGSTTLLGIAARLRADHPAMAVRAVMGQLLGGAGTAHGETVAEVVAACRAYLGNGGSFAAEAALCVELSERYRGDPGCVVSLLLNLVVLQPGEALVLGAGNLHAYIRGVGVELMANSDNVLRGGLTPKHVDAEELLRILDTSPLPHPVAAPVDAGTDGAVTWPTPCSEFRLLRYDTTPGTGFTIFVQGPEIVLVTAGTVSVAPLAQHAQPVQLRTGESAWIPAATRSYRLTGSGQVFRAVVDL